VFLGATSPDAVPAIREAMSTVAERAEPLAIELTRGGGTRHGVGWLESDEAESAVSGQLVLDLRAWLGLTSERAEHPFRAHATVCRGASSALIKELGAVRVTPPIAWRAGSIVLFRSRTGPGGSRYEVLATAEMALAPSAIR
jgi:2'-5' RNA ligase